MKRMLRSMFVMIGLLAALSGCALLGGGGDGNAAPPPPQGAVESLPTITPFIAPTAVPQATATPSVGRAGPGEILFVREGQIYATTPTGENERRLTLFEGEQSIRGLTISPSGQYAAFSIDGRQMMVFDVQMGVITAVDTVNAGGVSRPVWSPDSAVLYYQKIISDPASAEIPVSEVWQTAMPPGSPPQPLGAVSGEEGVGLTPRFALGVGQVLLGEVRAGEPGRVMVYQGGALTPLAVAGDGTQWGVWDISPDGTRALVFDVSDAAALYVADLSLTDGLFNPIRVSPADDDRLHSNAKFAADGQRILSLRIVPSEEGVAGNPADVVLFADRGSGYQGVVLAPENALGTVRMAWHSDAGIVVQRLSPDNAFELWFVPLSGEPARMLTMGEQPAVVGGR